MLRHRLIVAALTVPLVALFAIALPAQRQGRGAPPDFIYYNAKVVTVDDQFSYAQEIGRASCRERV